MKRIIRIILMIGLLGAMAACGGERPGPENIFIAYEADSGRSFTMGVGDVLQVTLDENESTGYLWSIVTNDADVLRESEESDYVLDSNAIGAGGRRTYTFEAIAPGTSVLRMVNARSGDTAVTPDRMFELTVEVVE